MKEQYAAHSFEEPKKLRPDFPQWIETEEGKECLQWPISEVKYLHNRLSWAFDAGRNCVWDQYIRQKAELTRLRSELQRKDEVIKELLPIAESFFDNYPLKRVKLVIEKAKLNN